MLLPFHDDNPIRRVPYVTIGIIVLNVLAMGFVWLQTDHSVRVIYARFGFVPLRLTQMMGSEGEIVVNLYPETEHGYDPDVQLPPLDERELALSTSPLAVLGCLTTCMFLHGGMGHLVGNMWFFWLYGNNVEDRLGPLPFALFYLFGGWLAGLAHWAATSGGHAMVPVIGASGAVAVTMGAYIVTWPRARIRCLVILFVVELPAVAVLGIWLGVQVLQGFGSFAENADLGVAWWAHIGGFAAGAMVMPLLTLVIPPPPPEKKEIEFLSPKTDRPGRRRFRI